ncbi:MAG: hypothetical protein EXX96DRAFT_568506 [Benjaminiella poitrasii]|nr:MAG: hypothetical protein EXX96DRAFT_568506 [Benjaminiella poitrasii]
MCLLMESSSKCVNLVAELKPCDKNSFIESETIKLAKQMRSVLNKLVCEGFAESKACGLHIEDIYLNTYVMDLTSQSL